MPSNLIIFPLIRPSARSLSPLLISRFQGLSYQITNTSKSRAINAATSNHPRHVASLVPPSMRRLCLSASAEPSQVFILLANISLRELRSAAPHCELTQSESIKETPRPF